MGIKTFPKITAYPNLKELQKRLLSGESILKIKTDLDKERYHISEKYLREYKTWLEDTKNNQQDEVLLELERKGYLPYVNEVSFLKAVVAGAFKNLNMEAITFEQGMEAASMLINRELKLPQNQAQKLQGLMQQFIITDNKATSVMEMAYEAEKEEIEDKSDDE